jgi:hypothetical protein
MASFDGAMTLNHLKKKQNAPVHPLSQYMPEWEDLSQCMPEWGTRVNACQNVGKAFAKYCSPCGRHGSFFVWLGFFG